jgi:hypothetical protein
MPFTLPLVGNGTSIVAPCQYPLQRSTTQNTQVVSFVNGSEQRWLTRSQRGTFSLHYININAADRNTLDTFFSVVQASFGVFSFSLPVYRGLPWANCQFEDDSFSWQENKMFPGRYSGSINFRETAPGVLFGPPSLAAFPSFGSTGTIRTGFPLVKTSNYQVARVDAPEGNRIAYPFYQAGLPNFPNRAPYSWTLTFANIPDADLVRLEAHFVSARGRLGIFGFTDPTTLTGHSRVRYNMDALEITHSARNLSSTTVKLCEVWANGYTLP